MIDNRFRTHLLASCAGVVLAVAASAAAQAADPITFDIPSQPLGAALTEFAQQSKLEILFSSRLARDEQAPAVHGQMQPSEALTVLLAQSGLSYRTTPTGSLVIEAPDPQGSSAAGGGAEVEGLIVTAQKREENIQDVPIAMSAFSQETLTERQVAGGPDLITQIPNMSFTKTNFTSYSIQIRGIGTQAISATTDPAVAVAFNNTPFIRNRFFEQEFYDLERLEVLRGPQGTLYGRNATAGVVNLISAKPKFHYEAKVSGDVANYSSARLEGMINIPLVEDVVALRLAGAWTKREGYAFNQMTGQQIDGRDLWSTRLSLRFEPTDWISANLIWEHFEEDDDRLRSGKQLCKRDVVTEIGGIPVSEIGNTVYTIASFVSQGCTAVSLYSPEAFQTPNGNSLPFYGPTVNLGNAVFEGKDPYISTTQSRDLRVIESSVEPHYHAETDIAELQIAIDVTDNLTFNSETSYSADSLFSLQDYNRFTTATQAFDYKNGAYDNGYRPGLVFPDGTFCDPQLGCSNRLLLVDLSTADSTQFSQEFRLGSDFDGPVNFSLGANYLRHDAIDKYYVFINSLSLFAALGPSTIVQPYVPNVTDNSYCAGRGARTLGPGPVGDLSPYFDPLGNYAIVSCTYIDPNPIDSLNDQGRNYFLSKNPYKLVSYALFGELYYNVTDSLKVTGGLRFTVDRKAAPQIPSWLLASNTTGPYPTLQTVFQEWREPTGRLAIDWKPDLGFTDETLVYASYAHGYKAGGANPPPPVFATYSEERAAREVLPDTFGPEFVDAFEIGAKNTLLDGAVILNLTGFYYDYKGYQVSEIRNRSAVNSNYDSEVWGAEIEADWRITEALKLGFKGGYNGTRIADGEKAIDLMDRTGGDPNWVVLRPFPTIPSNCIAPLSVLTAGGRVHAADAGAGGNTFCITAYYLNLDPITLRPYDPTITDYTTVIPSGSYSIFGPLGPAYADYHGFDPSTAPNGGKGIDKQLGGNELPNAPTYTATLTADYTRPLAGDWLMTLHGDYHWQSQSWGRIFNSDPYDRINAFSTVNVAGIFTNDDAGWKVMAYVKNVFDETAITGTFLNSDDTGLTTNVFLTEPRLYGIRVTKDFTGAGWLGDFGQRHDGPRPFTVELGGGVSRFGGDTEDYRPAWMENYSSTFPLPAIQDRDLDWGDTRSVKLTYAPSADWQVSAAYRFGKTNSHHRDAGYEAVPGGYSVTNILKYVRVYEDSPDNHWIGAVRDSEEHTIVDFTIGKEFGFGALGDGSRSMFSIGLRQADLRSTSRVEMDGIPHRVSPPEFSAPNGYVCCLPFKTYEAFTSTLQSDRRFEGWGPSLGWDASLRLWGDEDRGHADLDWSVSSGVLFGKQTMDSIEDRFGGYYIFPTYTPPETTLYDEVVQRSRTEDVTVPNLSLTLGVSYAIDRVKVSTGYSYDRFFDAIDGGYDGAQTYDRTIQGPYLKLSLGFGG